MTIHLVDHDHYDGVSDPISICGEWLDAADSVDDDDGTGSWEFLSYEIEKGHVDTGHLCVLCMRGQMVCGHVDGILGRMRHCEELADVVYMRQLPDRIYPRCQIHGGRGFIGDDVWIVAPIEAADAVRRRLLDRAFSEEMDYRERLDRERLEQANF